jgi:hypothetical protein
VCWHYATVRGSIWLCILHYSHKENSNCCMRGGLNKQHPTLFIKINTIKILQV